MRLNGRGVATLTLAGRRTGEARKVPVIPVEVGGSRYLVSPYGESDWVRNLRAAGKGELSRKGRSEVFHAVEVPVGQRGPVISRYREVAGRAWTRSSRSCLTPGIIRCSKSTRAIPSGDLITRTETSREGGSSNIHVRIQHMPRARIRLRAQARSHLGAVRGAPNASWGPKAPKAVGMAWTRATAQLTPTSGQGGTFRSCEAPWAARECDEDRFTPPGSACRARLHAGR